MTSTPIAEYNQKMFSKNIKKKGKINRKRRRERNIE